ncbi:MAG TPA: hypothetical protein VKK31_23485 [Thermoanaerobaculia bacterium]|nr:hypothetical protein [Thermoanaerobaculia bacterium]
MRRAFFILAFLLPAAVLAQPGRFEITPFAGYRLNGDFDAQSSDVFDPDLNIEIEESAIYGVLLDIPISRNWQIELLANRQRSAFIIDRGLLEPSRELGDVDLTIVHAGLLLQWGEGQVNPFVTISGGLTRIDPQFSELDADNRFSTSFGGGAKVFFSENVGLRLEARGFWTDLDTGFEDRFDRYDSGDGLFQGEASAGLIIAF